MTADQRIGVEGKAPEAGRHRSVSSAGSKGWEGGGPLACLSSRRSSHRKQWLPRLPWRTCETRRTLSRHPGAVPGLAADMSAVQAATCTGQREAVQAHVRRAWL